MIDIARRFIWREEYFIRQVYGMSISLPRAPVAPCLVLWRYHVPCGRYAPSSSTARVLRPPPTSDLFPHTVLSFSSRQPPVGSCPIPHLRSSRDSAPDDSAHRSTPYLHSPYPVTLWTGAILASAPPGCHARPTSLTPTNTVTHTRLLQFWSYTLPCLASNSWARPRKPLSKDICLEISRKVSHDSSSPIRTLQNGNILGCKA